MNNEEKILELLSGMKMQMDRMEAQMDRMEARMDRMEARTDRMEARTDRMEARTDRMEARMDRMGDDLQRVRLYLELDVEKRFDAINEGIDVIQENLLPEERMEKAENDIVVLKTAVKALAREVAELKKAE